MWLLPAFSVVSRTAAGVYYRIRYQGAAVPSEGPVLLVANHPNSLFDPVLVIAAARRPVRFLAKAPLFTDPKVGWLVRGSGSIPVYRRKDDPTQVTRNDEMFSAVEQALADGSAVALFPEGISHSEPGLTPLKTGAARIALGFASKHDTPLPIMPVGLVFREKDRFRSEARVVVGPPLDWSDLAAHGPDTDAVRALTDRITDALRAVTVNLEAWEDQPVVHCALDVWESALEAPPAEDERVARLRAATELLASIRAGTGEGYEALVEKVRTHRARLERLGIGPRDLSRDTSTAAAVRWSLVRTLFLSPPALLVGLLGMVLFLVPFRLTGWMADRFEADLDQRSTYKLLVGIPVYGLWVALAGLVAWRLGGPWWGIGAVTGLPLVGMAGLLIRERWRGAWSDARSFLTLRSRRTLVEELAIRQAALAAELDTAYRQLRKPGPTP